VRVVHEGVPGTFEFRVRYLLGGAGGAGGARISPWHNIPWLAGADAHGAPLFNFICEIPKGSVRKYEIQKSWASGGVADVSNYFVLTRWMVVGGACVLQSAAQVPLQPFQWVVHNT
jgi:hypothetical protein